MGTLNINLKTRTAQASAIGVPKLQGSAWAILGF